MKAKIYILLLSYFDPILILSLFYPYSILIPSLSHPIYPMYYTINIDLNKETIILFSYAHSSSWLTSPSHSPLFASTEPPCSSYEDPQCTHSAASHLQSFFALPHLLLEQC